MCLPVSRKGHGMVAIRHSTFLCESNRLVYIFFLNLVAGLHKSVNFAYLLSAVKVHKYLNTSVFV